MIKVSVVMPVYNAEEYLPLALESLLNQTLREIEIICVDDGSTDRSAEVLRYYQKKDDRIIVLSQKNSYAGVARNYGMSVARGKYLSFLDADDYFTPKMLEKAYNNAEEQKADIVIFGGEYFTEKIENRFYVPELLREEQIPEGDGFDNREKIEKLMTITTPAPWNKLFLRSFVEKHQLKFQACKRVNDLFFVEVALACADKIGIVRESLVYYRTDNGGSLQGTNKESPEQFATALMDVQSKLQEIQLYDKVKKSFRNLCLSNCIYNLECMHDADEFERLYVALKTRIFKEFHIFDADSEDYYNSEDYKKCIYILFHSPIQYWMDRCQRQNDRQYLFPYQLIPKGSRIALYGAGKVGKSFFRQLQKSGYCELSAWVDRSVRETEGQMLSIPADMDWNGCDYVVVAIEMEERAESVKKELHQKYGISCNKLIWHNPVLSLS